jgi:hypothetical protein
VFLIDLRLPSSGKNRSSPAEGAALPNQLLGLLKLAGGLVPVQVHCVAAKAIVDTLITETSIAATKRKDRRRADDDPAKFNLGMRA